MHHHCAVADAVSGALAPSMMDYAAEIESSVFSALAALQVL